MMAPRLVFQSFILASLVFLFKAANYRADTAAPTPVPRGAPSFEVKELGIGAGCVPNTA